MATLLHRNGHRVEDPAVVRDEHYVADEVRHDSGVAQGARFLALAAGVIVTIIGLMAVLDVDWGNAEWRRPLVRTAGMDFSPTVAVVTGVLGLLLIGVAATRASESKLAMGAILSAIGIAILLISDLENRWDLTDRHGWLALGVGVVFLIAGLLSDRRRVSYERRQVAERDL